MRFVNVLDALEFRKKGSFLARNREEGYVGLYFGPCTTLSTRIRCDVSNYFETINQCFARGLVLEGPTCSLFSSHRVLGFA